MGYSNVTFYGRLRLQLQYLLQFRAFGANVFMKTHIMRLRPMRINTAKNNLSDETHCTALVRLLKTNLLLVSLVSLTLLTQFCIISYNNLQRNFKKLGKYVFKYYFNVISAIHLKKVTVQGYRLFNLAQVTFPNQDKFK